jgi:hypothetical protein
VTKITDRQDLAKRFFCECRYCVTPFPMNEAAVNSGEGYERLEAVVRFRQTVGFWFSVVDPWPDSPQPPRAARLSCVTPEQLEACFICVRCHLV